VNLRRAAIAEFFGTAFLLMVVVGSGIMGESLAGGNIAIALLANSLATGAGLFVLIRSFGPLSGAHFNPVVTLTEVIWKRIKPKQMAIYWAAQFSGAIVGVIAAHAMFGQVLLQISTKVRFGTHLWISEAIATFGLLGTIMLSGKKNPDAVPVSVGLYVMAAYWFTSSTSFANPAVTVARMLTNSFCGIRPEGVAPFIVAQCVGTALAILLLDGLEKPRTEGERGPNRV